MFSPTPPLKTNRRESKLHSWNFGPFVHGFGKVQGNKNYARCVSEFSGETLQPQAKAAKGVGPTRANSDDVTTPLCSVSMIGDQGNRVAFEGQGAFHREPERSAHEFQEGEQRVRSGGACERDGRPGVGF